MTGKFMRLRLFVQRNGTELESMQAERVARREEVDDEAKDKGNMAQAGVLRSR